MPLPVYLPQGQENSQVHLQQIISRLVSNHRSLAGSDRARPAQLR
jgi:hypothetical protein